MEQNKEKREFSPPRCIELLRRFEEKESHPSGRKLQFSGIGENDVYNISPPFRIGARTVIAGRVEARTTVASSHIVFFEEKQGIWIPAIGAPSFQLEDGFATRILDETIFGGVETYPNPTVADSMRIGYRTAFYRGRDLSSLQKFATGPDMMKDIRLLPLAKGRIGVFTRPQEGFNGRGKIGYVELQSIEDLNTQNILSARIIENQFDTEEWGGADDLSLLQDGEIGVIGHIGYKDAEGLKHYYAMAFIYDPETHQASPIEIIATRKNFPAGEAKTQELADIVVPSGYDRKTSTLYAGLSDAEAGIITLPDPFGSK